MLALSNSPSQSCGFHFLCKRRSKKVTNSKSNELAVIGLFHGSGCVRVWGDAEETRGVMQMVFFKAQRARWILGARKQAKKVRTG
jgi:hypothetical protein